MIQRWIHIFILLAVCGDFAAGGELSIDAKLKEVTAKPDAMVVTIPFYYENKTDDVITIKNFNAPCTCMGARMVRDDGKRSLVIAPGEKGKIIGVLEFGNFKGTIDKVIEISTEKDPENKPSIILTCRVTIPILIATDKNKLTWDVGGALEPKEFRIKVAEESKTPLHVVKHEFGFGASEGFKYDIEIVTEGREYKVTVTPLKTNEPSVDYIKFHIDSSIPRYKLVQIYLMVERPIERPKEKK